MTDSAQQLQVLYEIAMSMGESLDLDRMLRQSMSAVCKRLNCPAGGVHLLSQGLDGLYTVEEVFSLPKDAASLPAYREALVDVPQGVDHEGIESYLTGLPRHIDVGEGWHAHLYELPDLGVVLLLKRGNDLGADLQRSLQRLFGKLAVAIGACLQNDELVEHRDQLRELMFENVEKLQEASEALLDRNKLLKNEIAERAVVEQELSLAMEAATSSDQAKSAFLANMSHEVRTPLNVIVGLTNLALKGSISPKVKDYLLKVRGASGTLLRLISDILDFSKIEAGKLDLEETDFDLRSVVMGLADMVGNDPERKGVEFLVSIGKDVPSSLRGDPLRLSQVLTNLLGNAVKFTKEGQIVVRVRRMGEHDGRVQIKFTVQDTGIGIEPEQLPRLFSSFTQLDVSTTRQYGGTGLGLTICQHLVQLMGGEIEVESAPGKGSAFSFTVGLGRQPEAEELRYASPSSLEGMRVLVVDDNIVSCGILQEMLSTFSFRSTAVQSGQAALEELQQADVEDPYRLVLLDWRMEGLNGVETARRIAPTLGDDRPHPKLVMVTAFGPDEVARQAKDVGLDGFLLKPVNQSLLFNTVLQIFGEQGDLVAMEDSGSGEVAAAEHQFSGVRLLLVEDIEINQEIARAILEDVGIEVDVVANGREALDRLAETDYDGALMDVQMPVMDGLEATRAIRANERCGDLPIIAMTAHARTGDRRRCLEAGMNDYVTKPIEVDILLATIARHIHPNSPAGDAAVDPTPAADSLTAEAQALAEAKTVPGIDLDSALSRLGGNRAVLQRILVSFGERFASADRDIQQAWDAGDKAQAGRALHALKGVAGNISAERLHGLSVALEVAVKTDDEAAFEATFNDLSAALAEVVFGVRRLAVIEATQPETSAVDAGDETNGETQALVEELSALLGQKSFAAKQRFADLRGHLDDHRFGALLAAIGEHIEQLNFAQAQALVDVLAKDLGTGEAT